MPELKSSHEWALLLLPDDAPPIETNAWDPYNFEASWVEPVTQEVFSLRLELSTYRARSQRLEEAQEAKDNRADFTS